MVEIYIMLAAAAGLVGGAFFVHPRVAADERRSTNTILAFTITGAVLTSILGATTVALFFYTPFLFVGILITVILIWKREKERRRGNLRYMMTNRFHDEHNSKNR